MQAPIMQLDQVTKVYQAGAVEVQALRGIDLSLHQGEWLAIVGRSGSGKSTLMNILGCLDLPTSGRYQLQGQDISQLDDDVLSKIRGKTIGFVFQSFHLLASVNVSHNVALPMEYQRVGAKERNERACELLNRVGLGHRLLHRPNELSGGERQRVAIARALANHPRVLLADEPTGNLDTQAQGRILDLFAQLHEEMGITLVMVTHDMTVADLAQRVVQISDGRATQLQAKPISQTQREVCHST